MKEIDEQFREEHPKDESLDKAEVVMEGNEQLEQADGSAHCRDRNFKLLLYPLR